MFNPLVVALAYDGLCTFEFGIAVEVFGLPRPEMGENWYQFAVAGLENGAMRATGGIHVVADGGLELLIQAGTIIIPGWKGSDVAVPGHLIDALRQAHQQGARLLSICSGVFVLAATGLLSGRRATTHWRYSDTLKMQYPDINIEPDVLYIDEGTILTSAGSAAGIDLGLHLIRRDYGSKAANQVARRLVVAPHRDGGQAQYIEKAVPVDYERSRLGPLIDHVRANLAEEYSVRKLAMISCMSPRTFLRRFSAATGTTPARWLLAERLNTARDLLENTRLSIEKIAETVGFGTAASLRHHFRQQLDLTPSTYRLRFGQRTDDIPENLAAKRG
ncbi:transcriptional regulator FtrA [Pectobacterium punjabense]|uniref:transcriptional regulator FtrA n=1 Tax=Pectobacterium punjabense TaxID=2108399 RepID=UPI001969779E|nr:transcriptional regulator FtrA [Pectobacterium punjabense]MBN3135217.1 transcriptional regulator FtrA [Pectobacterium punjabense]MBT9182737.1 transcriptional regulator FtrA [Pectobacterium punjabense]MCE5379435.1 transcriptional regulator FtrA [Pectobacterium punjabense]GKW12892.1 transcriptional regulator FtrA [Pectobacterium carotovorum subsp. carotovorum]